jgi:7-cyano-7-deazaguanine synthase
MKPLVLFSGGIDSAVCLEITREESPPGLAVTFDYGQPHRIEIEYATRLASKMGFEHQIHSLPHAPKTDDVVFAGRNLMFIAAAVPIAVANGRDTIIIGSNFSDFERFPDCRPPFIRAVNNLLDMANYGVSVFAPLSNSTKERVIDLAVKFEIDMDETWSCYSPAEGKPCGLCLACETRGAA